MSAQFPTAIKTYTSVSQGNKLPYDVVQSYQDEINGIESALINGVARTRSYNSTGQSLNNSTLTALNFDVEDFDIGSLHTTANPSRMTVPTGLGGGYLVIGKCSFAASTVGARQLRIRKNGADDSMALNYQTVLEAANCGVGITALLSLAAGDYVELWAFQDSGGALNTGSTSRTQANELAMVKLW